MATAQVVTTAWIEISAEVWEYEITWTSTDAGVVSHSLAMPSLSKIMGWYLFMAKVNPGVTPTAAWDWTLKDSDGIDLMGGLGADMSNSVSVLLIPKLDGTNYGDVLVDGELTFAIAAAGDAKPGVNSFFFRKVCGR